MQSYTSKQECNTIQMIKQVQNIHGCTSILGQKLTKRISESVAVASEVHMAI